MRAGQWCKDSAGSQPASIFCRGRVACQGKLAVSLGKRIFWTGVGCSFIAGARRVAVSEGALENPGAVLIPVTSSSGLS